MDGTGQLTVRTARDGDRVLDEIGDNGPGIPEAAAAAHILEPFSTTKPVGQGTGLGLDSCWRIVVRRRGGWWLRWMAASSAMSPRRCSGVP
jgi:C4-dicarboxylate-specific signal transduction histidine kinase